MKEQDIVFQVINLLQNNFTGFTIQTDGGGGDVDLPAIVLTWSTSRLSNVQGHDVLAGYQRDSSGNVTHVNLHRYHRMDLDITVQSRDEGERDTTLNQIQDLFFNYEWESDNFHADTFEWDVGNVEPRNNPVMEPDWYASGVVVSLRFVQEVSKSVDALTSVQEGIYIDETLDE